MATIEMGSGAVNLEFKLKDGCHEIWLSYPGDKDGAFLIGASEVAEGGTQQSAIQSAMNVLTDAASLLVDAWKTNNETTVAL